MHYLLYLGSEASVVKETLIKLKVLSENKEASTSAKTAMEEVSQLIYCFSNISQAIAGTTPTETEENEKKVKTLTANKESTQKSQVLQFYWVVRDCLNCIVPEPADVYCRLRFTTTRVYNGS